MIFVLTLHFSKFLSIITLKAYDRNNRKPQKGDLKRYYMLISTHTPS